jgi:CIC family chloride channel protein
MSRIRNWFQKAAPPQLVILSIIVGLGGALGAAVFHTLIYYSTFAFYGHHESTNFISLVQAMPIWQRLLIPTLGGLLVGIIFKFAKVSEAEGEGVPEVMEALAHRRGTIRPIVAPLKILTAAITLGSGGSAGREGPVIQIGSAIGSSIGQFMHLASSERSLLLAAGAAAGIGGTFGAPIAGVLFTIEILHHRAFSLIRAFSIIIAAFVGTYGAQLLTGHAGLRFDIDTVISAFSILTFISLLGLGALAAMIALVFGTVLTRARQIFQKIHLPHWLKPAAGGLLIGMIGLYLPYIHEPAAYPFMVDLLAIQTLPLAFLIMLLLIKMVATSVTLGSGGSGGIFAPLLLMGAITGSIFASILLMLHIIPATNVSMFIVIGMAAVFAGAAHAPLTASFITYEMTDNIFLLPLLLVVCFVATYTAKRISRQSVYHVHNENE